MDAVFVFKSSFRGLCRELVGKEGDEGGSFFTIILGAPAEPRPLQLSVSKLDMQALRK